MSGPGAAPSAISVVVAEDQALLRASLAAPRRMPVNAKNRYQSRVTGLRSPCTAAQKAGQSVTMTSRRFSSLKSTASVGGGGMTVALTENGMVKTAAILPVASVAVTV